MDVPTFEAFIDGPPPAKQVSSGVIRRPQDDQFSTFLNGLHEVESSFGTNPAISKPNHAGAIWDYQITPIAAKDVGIDYNRALTDRAYANEGAIKYAKKVWDAFGGNPSLAAAAYNAGPTLVRRLLKEAPEGEDPGAYVFSRLGQEARGHNQVVMKHFGGVPQLKGDKRAKEIASETEAGLGVSFSTFVGDLPLEGDEVGKPKPMTWGDAFKKAGKDAMEFGKGTLAVANLLTSLPSFIVGTTGGVSAATVGMLSGESPKDAYRSGLGIGEHLTTTLDRYINPVNAALHLLNSPQALDETVVNKAMHSLTSAIRDYSRHVEKSTGNRMPAEGFEMLVNTAMVAAGGRAAGLSRDRTLLRDAIDATKGERESRARVEGQRAEARWDTQRDLEASRVPPAPKFDDFTPAAASRRLEADFDAIEQSVAEADKKQITDRRLRFAVATGAGTAVGVGAGYLYDKFRDTWKDGGEPEPTPDGTYLARNNPGWEQLAPLALAAGWIKGPGGMWHPEAVERLSSPLKGQLAKLYPERRGQADPNAYFALIERGVSAADAAKQLNMPDMPAVAWAERSIKNYLNKYAGTARDPLKDIEIPFGDGVRRWEELTDKVILGKSAQQWIDQGARQREITELSRARPDEQIWKMKDYHYRGPVKEYTAIQSYLSHVGDYLRQNVPVEKLQQYDLVRAVKETVAHDAKMARLAEKASSDSTKQLPVHKDYGDGFRWVELKLPDELTPEQAKGVIKNPNAKDYTNVKGQLDHRGDYVAVDSQGKPIENSYTREIAAGRTPQEAYLAGRLAEEGNQMGHCVGGYCAPVASGESRIYSLRDAKGKSHVTVEVAPGGPEPIRYGQNYDAYVEAARGPHPDNIIQIKGKGNRAPVADYLPYVQDFVRSGKWGEVGDLGNTGLHRVRDDGIVESHRGGHIARTDKAPGYYTEAELFEESVAGPRGQRGSASPELLKAMAIAGVGASVGYLASEADQKLLSSIMGAGAALGLKALHGKTRGASSPIEVLDYGLGIISTRMRNMSESLRFKAVDYERRVLRDVHYAFDRVHPFLDQLKKLPKETSEALNRAIISNENVAVSRILKELKNPEITKAWQQTREVLDELGERWKGQGRISELLKDYFPRMVKDVEGLLGAIGADVRPGLEAALRKANLEAEKTRGTPLSQLEESIIINKFLRDWRSHGDGKLGPAHSRRVKEVTEDIVKFYATPAEALHSYIGIVTRDLEKARFFGEDLAQQKRGDVMIIDTDTSIGNLVARERAKGKITDAQEVELKRILKSRFTDGEKGASPWVQDLKNLANAGLLGNVVSAMTQFGDAFVPMYAYGMRDTLASVARNVTGRSKVNVRDFGLVDHLAEEFASTRSSQQALNLIFKGSGFAAVDRFGKNVLLGAALERMQREARTPDGRAKLAKKYGESLGDEFPGLVSDLLNKNKSDRVSSVLFAELSDFQPITRMEVPQAYLDHPNGRTLYMLKTFMIKQGDIVRRDAYNEIKKGNVREGLGNLAKYGLVIGVAGATTEQIKNWMMGRDDPLKGKDIWLNVLKTFGLNEYMMDKATGAGGKKADPVQAVLDSVLPPYKMMMEIIRLDPKAVNYIPLAGKLIESRLMGGGERATGGKDTREMLNLVDPETALLQKRQREDRQKLYRDYQAGREEAFESGLEAAREKYELTESQVRAIRQNAKLPPEVRKFKGLPLEQQRDILRKSSPEQREKLQPHAKRALRNEQF